MANLTMVFATIGVVMVGVLAFVGLAYIIDQL